MAPTRRPAGADRSLAPLGRVPARRRPSVVLVVASAFLLVVLLVVGPSPPTSGSTVPAATRPEEGEILRLYRSALGRDPDVDGYHYWVSRRIEGVPLAVVADSFLVGREFERRFGAGDDAAFVDRVYDNVLGRPGDAEGVAYWRAELGRGLDRSHLVLLFSESTELRRRTGTELADLPAWSPVVRTVDVGDVAASWRPGCPVGPEGLRAVELDHVDGDGTHRRGVLVINEDVVDDVLGVFERLYRARYPIVSMRPVDEFVNGDGRADDDLSMAANNTSAFNCRTITGGTRFSRHAWGRAIDLNPIENPYVSGSTVLPPAGADFVDRGIYDPAMIRRGDEVTRAFADVGWTWGGDWVSLKDYQHFQR